MLSDVQLQQLDRILELNQYQKRRIIAILQAIQQAFSYLPEEALRVTADAVGINQAKIFSIATFYENFSLQPKGRFVIKICDGTACHVRHSQPILEALRKELGLSESVKTTKDRMFTVETVSCLGACGLAPVLTVNDKVHAAMTPEKTLQLLKELKEDAQDADQIAG